ncbi:MAG TPA: hypothetical protein VFU06_16170 [Longimicrobiales bacterium]|nr:hypothetical protein [Longimicrobiales bacterium]
MILIGIRALAVTLVAVASLQLALHVAETAFLMRNGLGGDARIAMVLGLGGAIVVGSSLYRHSQVLADRIVSNMQRRRHEDPSSRR